jgi:hypothetical protein
VKFCWNEWHAWRVHRLAAHEIRNHQ